MTRRLTFFCFFCALMAGLVAVMAAGANFAGTWELDKAKSEGLQGPAATAQSNTLTVTQTDKVLTAVTKVVGADGQAMPAPTYNYNLDGSETTTEITGRMTGKAKNKVKWMSDGKILEINSIREISVQGQDVTITVKEHWELADDGKALKIHRTTETPRGTQEQKLVYNKKPAA